MMRVPLCVQMSLQIHDGAIAVVPERLLVERRVREPFAAQNFRMHADDQHLLVIGSVEDADPPAFRQIAGGAPEKIVLQFRGAGMLEAEYLAALRIDAGHHVLDGAILSGRIHRLKNQQHARGGWMRREAAAARSVAQRALPEVF